MTVGPDVTAVTVTRLSPNTSYTVKVRAVNAIGKRSEHLNVTTAPQGQCNIQRFNNIIIAHLMP